MTGRLVIVYAGYVGRGGGVVQHLRQVRAAVEARGQKVTVLSLDSLPPGVRLLPHVVRRALDAVQPPWGTLLRYRVGRALLRVPLTRLLRRGDVAAVLFEDVYSAVPVPVPSLAVLHALETHNLQGFAVPAARVAAARRLEGRWLRAVPCAVVTVSAPYRDVLLADLGAVGVIAPPIDVVPLGIDVDRFPNPPRPRRSDRLELAFLGFLVARKNLGFLPELARALKALIEFRLTIVGDGPLRRVLERHCDALGVSDVVRFHGRIGHDDVPHALQHYHVLVHPSLVESFAYSLLEAKLAGCWTLTTPGLAVPPEFCDVACPLEPAAWAEHLARHCDALIAPLSPARLAELREIRARFNVERMVSDYLERLGCDSRARPFRRSGSAL